MCGKKNRERKRERSVGKINKAPTPNPSAKETINHRSPSYILSLFLCGVDKQKYLLGTSLPSEHIHTHRLSQTHTQSAEVKWAPQTVIFSPLKAAWSITQLNAGIAEKD